MLSSLLTDVSCDKCSFAAESQQDLAAPYGANTMASRGLPDGMSLGACTHFIQEYGKTRLRQASG